MIYIEAYARVAQAVANFSTAIQIFEVLHLHRLKKRNENHFVYAVMDCFNAENHEFWDAIRAAELLPLETFTLNPELKIVPMMLRHPTKDLTMTFANRILFTRFIDFFVHDWLNGMHFGHAPIMCENCGRYFLSTDGHMRKYCDGMSPFAPRLTCWEEAAQLGQKEKNKDYSIYIPCRTRCNTIRKHEERGKISHELREAAIRAAETHRERAILDSDYAKKQYLEDLKQKAIYE